MTEVKFQGDSPIKRRSAVEKEPKPGNGPASKDASLHGMMLPTRTRFAACEFFTPRGK